MLIQHLGTQRVVHSTLARGLVCISRAECSLRTSSLRRIRSITQNIDRQQTSASPAKSVKRYPERLLIYHAKTGRIVFLGCLKLTTIFICVYYCFVNAPSYFYVDNGPAWVAFAVGSGIIPLIFVHYFSGPFVAYIHLHLPAYVRRSQQYLTRYTQTLPPTAELDITTMSFIGKTRVARMRIQDLKPVRERFGLVNYTRDTTEVNSQRKWWMGKAVSQFGVHGNHGKSDTVAGDIWNRVAGAIAKYQR